MAILHIEHPITDLATWQGQFSRFAPAREQAGVIDAHIYQPVDDPKYIVVNLAFASADAAERFRDFLIENVWSSPETAPGLAGTPKAVVLEEVDRH